MKLVTQNQSAGSETGDKAEQISAMVDGELTPAEMGAQIPRLLIAGRERQQWQSYHLLRDLLQQQLPEGHHVSFTRKVMNQLKDEPTVLAPAKKARSLTQKLVGLGLAASVAAVALLSSYVVNHSDTGVGQPLEMVADAQTPPKTVVEVAQWKRAPELEQVKQEQEPDLKQFSTYLANHAASSAGNGKQGFMPYARVVGYSSEK